MQICYEVITKLSKDGEIYPKIYERIFGIDVQHTHKRLNGFLLKLLTNNIDLCWKRKINGTKNLITKRCKWCGIEWIRPVKHMLLECAATQIIYDNNASLVDDNSPRICHGKITINELIRRSQLLAESNVDLTET